MYDYLPTAHNLPLNDLPTAPPLSLHDLPTACSLSGEVPSGVGQVTAIPGVGTDNAGFLDPDPALHA